MIEIIIGMIVVTIIGKIHESKSKDIANINSVETYRSTADRLYILRRYC